MNLRDDVKPITYLKNHTAELVRQVAENGRTVVVTQNGEAKVVLQDIHVYEQLQESLALLKMLAQSKRNVQEGKTKPVRSAFRDARKRVRRGQDVG